MSLQDCRLSNGVAFHARAQQAGRSYRIGFLNPSGRVAPPTVAFLDELRLNGFVEGQNFEVIPGGFDLRSDQATELAVTIIKDSVVYTGQQARVSNRAG